MKKVYNITVVGTLPEIRYVVQFRENVICKSRSDALGNYKDKLDIWSSTVKFNLKETVKLWILDMFDLDSINITLPNIKFNKKTKSGK